MKISSKLAGLFTMLILLPMLAHATGGGVPLDGGLSLLVAAGVGYGAKKIADNRKKNKSEENTHDN